MFLEINEVSDCGMTGKIYIKKISGIKWTEQKTPKFFTRILD